MGSQPSRLRSSLVQSTVATGVIPLSMKPCGSGWQTPRARLVGAAIIILVVHPGIPRSVYILEWIISCSLTLGIRFAVRLAMTVNTGGQRSYGDRTKTLIYGAGAAGMALARELRENQSLKTWVVGLIDDDPRKVGLTFHGKRVLGAGEALGALARKYEIEQIADRRTFRHRPTTRPHVAVRH